MSEKKRVLIMEDSSILLKMMKNQLEAAGFEVEVAVNGKEGLGKVDSFEPLLVLVDLMMPEVDGFEVTRTLTRDFPDVKIVVFSAQPAQKMEKEVLAMGARNYLQKPISPQDLLQVVKLNTGQVIQKVKLEPTILPRDNDQPYEIHLKACYICGYESVNVFVPCTEAFEEDWSFGLYPLFKAKEGYREWDHMKTMVSVCPSCRFASMHANDFAIDADHRDFPYKIDAKKILTRSISTRKRLIDSNDEVDNRFSNPNRSRELVIAAFKLAEKCANGLILGDKPSAYSDIGIYALMLGVLEQSNFHNKGRNSLNSFIDQLKMPRLSRARRAKAYYFIISLHMALGESIIANERRQEYEKLYEDLSTEDASYGERLWNQRLYFIWKNGVDTDTPREIL